MTDHQALDADFDNDSVVSDPPSVLDAPEDFEEPDSDTDYSPDEPTDADDKPSLDSLISDAYKLDKLVQEIIAAKERGDRRIP